MLRAIIDLVILALLVIFIFLLLQNPSYLQNLNINLNNLSIGNLGNVVNVQNLTYPIITPPNNIVPQNQTIAYALSLINNDRNANGLPNVSYSNESSAQQHSNSMLQYKYFSHWDPYGLKPYMRYTLLGGTGLVDENVAYVYDSAGVNVLKALKNMEYNMTYNDQACCANGHRFNILDPHHNLVSIGITYNRTIVYFTEDFIDNYINWFYGTPSYNNGAVALKGSAISGYYISSVEVSYDNPVQNMSYAQLNKTRSYSFGQAVAGVGHRSGNQYFSFNNLTTINATNYNVQNNNFDIEFNINKIVSSYGAGEYSIMVFLTNNTNNSNPCYTDNNGVQRCSIFLASTYTIFINSNGQQYVPANI